MLTPRVALACAAAALAGLAACDSPRKATCEGERIGTFRFHGEVAPDAGCPFDAPAVDFTATLTSGGGTSVLLCLDRPDAEPLRGDLSGGHYVVSTPGTAANVPSCTCDVVVEETVDLVPADGGGAAFSGELRDVFTPAASGATCERDAAPGSPPGCGVPCEIRWQLTGA